MEDRITTIIVIYGSLILANTSSKIEFKIVLVCLAIFYLIKYTVKKLKEDKPWQEK